MVVVLEAGIGFRVWTTTWRGHNFGDSSEMLVHPVPSLQGLVSWKEESADVAAVACKCGQDRGGSIRSILLLASWYGGRGGSIRSTRETHFFLSNKIRWVPLIETPGYEQQLLEDGDGGACTWMKGLCVATRSSGVRPSRRAPPSHCRGRPRRPPGPGLELRHALGCL
jgi:hypothetical protein